ncbi:MAG: PQQ-dependent sugar dehydrogenase, partial [Tepidiformaceae bacterium]
MKPAAVAAGLAVVAIVVVGTLGVLAASGDLPWRSRVPEIASDGTGDAPTPVASETATPQTPGAPAAQFNVAFPKLPKLDQPTNMIEIPGQGTMLLSQQDGRIVTFTKDANTSDVSVVLDLTDKTSRDGQEEGLLGLALDPNFAANGCLYAYYSASGGSRRTVLSRFN